jgi:hypothetical protein
MNLQIFPDQWTMKSPQNAKFSYTLVTLFKWTRIKYGGQMPFNNRHINLYQSHLNCSVRFNVQHTLLARISGCAQLILIVLLHHIPLECHLLLLTHRNNFRTARFQLLNVSYCCCSWTWSMMQHPEILLQKPILGRNHITGVTKNLCWFPSVLIPSKSTIHQLVNKLQKKVPCYTARQNTHVLSH